MMAEADQDVTDLPTWLEPKEQTEQPHLSLDLTSEQSTDILAVDQAHSPFSQTTM